MEFAKGGSEMYELYLSEDVRWNILCNSPNFGKAQVLDVLKMLLLESFPVISIKTVISEGNIVVIESTGVATTKNCKPYNQTYCDVYNFKDGKIFEFSTYLDTALSNEVDKE